MAESKTDHSEQIVRRGRWIVILILSLFVLSVALVAVAGYRASTNMAAGPARLTTQNSTDLTDCPNAPNGAFSFAAQSSDYAVSSPTLSTSMSWDLTTPSNSPTGGVPGVIEFCVYPNAVVGSSGGDVSAVTGTSTSAVGADSSAWEHGVDTSGQYAFAQRPDGNPSNIPDDGSTTTNVLGVTFSTAPTTFVVVLHINDPTECSALFGGSVSTCFVFPGGAGKASPSISTAASPTGDLTLGTTAPTLTDTATLSGGSAPTGMITFNLYYDASNPITGNSLPPPACTGTIVDTESATVSGDGSYSTPTGFTLPTTGTVTGYYQWVAAYGGDASNNAASSTCTDSDEAAHVVPASPGVSTTASPSGTLALGTTSPTLTDTATLSGGYSPTGSVSFQLFYSTSAIAANPSAPPACTGTVVDTESATVTGNGAYATPTGYALPSVGTVTGFYQWYATYSGDPNNNAAATSCTDSAEAVQVTAASPSLSTTASSSITLGTTQQVLTDSATLAGGYFPTGTITFHLYFSASSYVCSGTALDGEQVTVNGNGVYTTPAGFTTPASGTVAGHYQWVASYSGDGNNNGVAGTTCPDSKEQTLVSKASPTISTIVSKPTIIVTGGPVPSATDAATLSGGYYPTGTITFTVYAPSDPTCSGAGTVVGTKTVNGNGPYTSPSFTPTTIGTYHWIASYSGDANNVGTASACADEPMTVTPQSGVTNTAFCAFSQINLIYVQGSTGYELVASNPGQFYDNVFIVGTPGNTVPTTTIAVPFPFVTQGSFPIQTSSTLSFTSTGCFVPALDNPIGAPTTTDPTLTSSGHYQIQLGDYAPSYALGSTTSVTVNPSGTAVFPSTGIVYVTIHLDYGLKGTFFKQLANTGAPCTNPPNTLGACAQWQDTRNLNLVIGNPQGYSPFTIGSPPPTLTSANTFKKDPGFAGAVVSKLTESPIQGATVTIYINSVKVATVTTDASGYWSYAYKYTGSSTSWKAVAVYGSSSATATGSLKSNALVIQSFAL